MSPLLTSKTDYAVSRNLRFAPEQEISAGRRVYETIGNPVLPVSCRIGITVNSLHSVKKKKIFRVLCGGDTGCYRFYLGFYDFDPACRVNGLYGLEEIS